jgi:uncharacterized protein
MKTRFPMMWYSKIEKAVCGVLVVFFISAGACYARNNDPDPLDSDKGPNWERTQEDYDPFPNPDSGYVSDHAYLLGAEKEEKIERWLWQIESKTGVEIIVITIASIKDYPGTPNQSIEQFATALFDAYEIGNLPRNDGVLLLVCVSDRKAKIELGAGYGRSRDGDARRIMTQVIVPKFKDADYAAGITAGVKAIALEFAHARIGINWPLVLLCAAVPILILISISLFVSGKRGWGWICIGLLLVVLMALFYVMRQVSRHTPGSGSSSWSSGGMGGFGGGFSGGGGATGSW